MRDNELSFDIKRADEKHIHFSIFIKRDVHTGERINVTMTDTQFDLLMETIIAFTDSEPEREPIHFVGSA